MHGVTQNVYHLYDVWTHTLKTLELIPTETGIIVRLAALLHDVGKPPTRSVDEHGTAHFYRHEVIVSDLARRLMRRLTFSNAEVSQVSFPDIHAPARRGVITNTGQMRRSDGL